MATADVVQDMGQTLVTLLRLGAIPGVAAADVILATPDEFESLATRAAPFPPTTTVSLYRITVSAEMRNAPKRTLPDGTVTRPLLPLELHYLVTAWATDTAAEHRIAGHVLQLLYDHAELGAAELQGASWAPGDSVQLVLASLPVEEHFQVWETTDAPYRLSLPYIARVIGIEPAVRQAHAPVLDASFGGRP
jgi:hypothetical protein